MGKSTVIKKVFNILDEKNIAYDNLTIHKGKKIKMKNIYPIFMALCLTFKFKPKSLLEAYKILRDLAFHFIISSSSDEGKIIKIYDEGIIHKARALRRFCEKPDLNRMLVASFKYVEIPDVLIVLEASPEVIYKRRKKRNRQNDVFNYETIKKETKDLEVEEMFNVYRHDKNGLGKKIKIINVNNNKTDDIKIAATKIVSIILNEKNKK